MISPDGELNLIPFETLVIAHHETVPEHPMYARLRSHPHRFVACPELADIAALAEDAVTFTTFSAAACLAQDNASSSESVTSST